MIWPLVVIGVVLLVGSGAVAVQAMKAARVLERDRARGVHPQLQALLNAWEREGTHDVIIAGGKGWTPAGGLRVDESSQAAAAGAGLTNAATLSQTPHGRGAALDVWPYGFNPHRGFDEQPGMRELMMAFGEWAEKYGMTWGGRWSRPDYPHIELPGWQDLPFPPPDYGGVA